MTESTQVPGGRSTADDVIARKVSHNLRVLVSRMQLYADSVGHELGLHRSDLMAMNLMSQASLRGHAMTPGEVAKKMSLSAAAVTALVDRLEDVGHLVRTPDVKDRRRVRLGVSKQAATVSRSMFRPMNDRLYAALAHYTAAELDVVARVLADMTEAIEEAETDQAIPGDPKPAETAPTGHPPRR
ncbi:MAG: MarR family transcriptional regulator [Ornithinimicrobium sp.]